jgi:hypothetical protein
MREMVTALSLPSLTSMDPTHLFLELPHLLQTTYQVSTSTSRHWPFTTHCQLTKSLPTVLAICPLPICYPAHSLHPTHPASPYGSIARPNFPPAKVLALSLPTDPLAVCSTSPPTLSHRWDFTAKEFLGLAREVAKKNPFAAKHGKKGAAWEEVACALKANGMFMTSSTDVIKQKAMVLIKYQNVHVLNNLHFVISLIFTLVEP